jgi:hypothetical protein
VDALPRHIEFELQIALAEDRKGGLKRMQPNLSVDQIRRLRYA